MAKVSFVDTIVDEIVSTFAGESGAGLALSASEAAFSDIKVPFPAILNINPRLTSMFNVFCMVVREAWYKAVSSFSVGILSPGLYVAL